MQPVVPTCLLLGAIAACHTPAAETTDATTTADSPTTSTDKGLSIDWATSPATIPGSATSDITISAMKYRLANLRVIGDAGPGDTRTSIATIELDWATGTTPMPIAFADAPSGLYSKVILVADGNLVDYSYELAGTAKLDGVPLPFTIHDRSPLAISLDASATLEPNQTASLAITIRIDQALQSLDFHKLTNSNGMLTLDTFDDAMSDFRSNMMSNVFESTDDGPH